MATYRANRPLIQELSQIRDNAAEAAELWSKGGDNRMTAITALMVKIEERLKLVTQDVAPVD